MRDKWHVVWEANSKKPEIQKLMKEIKGKKQKTEDKNEGRD
jgi:hypothetical protein